MAVDITYQKAFLITFKSFTTVDELVDLLIQRFWIQPPAKLNPAEREQWGTQKQRVVQARSDYTTSLPVMIAIDLFSGFLTFLNLL